MGLLIYLEWLLNNSLNMFKMFICRGTWYFTKLIWGINNHYNLSILTDRLMWNKMDLHMLETVKATSDTLWSVLEIQIKNKHRRRIATNGLLISVGWYFQEISRSSTMMMSGTKNEFVLRFTLTFESPHYCKHNSLTHQHQVPYQG